MQHTCFVMMPFREKFKDLYETVIEPAIRQVGLIPQTGETYEPGSIPDRIIKDIRLATVAIAVLTEGNWNVAYEMGLAHQAEVPVFALVEGAPEELPTKVPFDIRHHRVFTYRPTDEGKKELQLLLVSALPKLQDEHLLAQMLSP